jgi:hypothetical protein
VLNRIGQKSEQPNDRRCLIVTPEQLADGWVLKVPGLMIVEWHEFKVIGRLDNGNYIVERPDITEEAQRAKTAAQKTSDGASATPQPTEVKSPSTITR